MNIEIKIEIITPAIAQSYLEKNTHNRAPKKSAIDQYAREMLAGRWAISHQGIAFDEEGNLLDGQNRLMAVVASGVTIQMAVTRGLPKNVEGDGLFTMDVIDIGRNRSAADQLRVMHGIEQSKAVVPALRMVGAICGPTTYNTCKMTVAQAMGLYAIYGKEVTEVISRVASFRPARHSSVIGALAFCAAAAPEVLQATEQLASGEGLEKGNPTLALRNQLINESRPGFRRSSGPGNQLVMEWVGKSMRHSVLGLEMVKLRAGKQGLDFFRSKQRENVEKVHALA